MSPRHAVYVSNAESGDIHLLHLAVASGSLTLVQRVDVGGAVMPLALSPDQRFLYAARRSEPWAVLSYGVDRETGELTLLGEAPLPQSMAFIACDRSGRTLLSASYGGHLIAVSPITESGIAQPAQQVLPTEPNAHAVVADPSNRWVYSTSLGGGVVRQWRFDAERRVLTPNDPPALSPHAGASPRHLVFGRDAHFVYLLSELDAAIDVLEVDADRGTLRTVQTVSALPPGFAGEPWAADLHLTPDGRFLYASERRSSTLAAFSVDAASGRLAPVAQAAHTATQAQPRGFAITPDGRFLIAAGQASHRLSVYAIDATSGALTERSTHAAGRNPNWVETIALPA